MIKAVILSLVSGLIGAIIGGCITICIRLRDARKQRAFYASLLMCDLDSIKGYIDGKFYFSDIRYNENWQQILAECVFLSADSVKVIYSIYDGVYNFNYRTYYEMKIDVNFDKIKTMEFDSLREKFYYNFEKKELQASYRGIAKILFINQNK
jgi:hypothetical protein